MVLFPGRVIPGAWLCMVSAGTCWPGVSILGEVESLICNFCLSGAARTAVWSPNRRDVRVRNRLATIQIVTVQIWIKALVEEGWGGGPGY